MIEGIVEAIMISLFAIYIFGNQVSLNEGGYSSDLWIVGITTYLFSYVDFLL